MSTVREHLGLLWLLRRQLAATDPQYDQHWAMQASQFVGVHLDELIALAGGADIEDWARKHFPEIPADFPANRPTATSAAGLSAPSVSADAKDAARWRMLTAFTEEHQIDYVRLIGQINAAIAVQSKEPKGAGE